MVNFRPSRIRIRIFILVPEPYPGLEKVLDNSDPDETTLTLSPPLAWSELRQESSR